MSYTTNIINAKKKFHKLIEMVTENDEVIIINTQNGNLMMISEREYKSLIETIHLSSHVSYKKSIALGLKTPYEQTSHEDKNKW